MYHSLVHRLWCRWFVLNKLLSQRTNRKKETRAPFGLGTVPTYGLYDVVAKAYTQVLQVFDEVGSPTTELMVTGCPCDGDHQLSPRGYHRLSPCGYVHRAWYGTGCVKRHSAPLQHHASGAKLSSSALARNTATKHQGSVLMSARRSFLGLVWRSERPQAEIWPHAEIACCPVTSSLSSSSDIDQ